MMKRRDLLLVLPFAKLAFSATYSTSSRLADGTIATTGYRNGYPFTSQLKMNSDGTVAAFQFAVTATRPATVENLFRAVGLDMIVRTDVPNFLGQPLLVQLEDVAGSFNVLVNGQIFLNDNIGSHTVTAGQQVTAILATTGKLVAK